MKQYFLLAVSALLVFASCKKDKDEPVIPTQSPKLKSYTTQGGSTTSFEYDAQKRVSKTISGTEVDEITYATNIITVKTYQNGIQSNQVVYNLNAAGLAALATYQIGITYQYTYNNLGQRLSQIGSIGSKQNYFYTGFNMDSMHIIDPSNNIIQRWYFQYNTSINNTIGLYHEGYSFTGRINEKPYSMRTVKFYDANGQLLNTQVNNYAHETDSQGRITREIMTGGTAHDITFTYY